MRILFLEIDVERAWAVASIGPACLAPLLRARGHEVELVRIPPDEPIPAAVARIRSRRPELLALSLTSRQWLRGRAVVGAVRREMDVPVIAGGLHPTFAAGDVLASPGFDFVCLGEGEEAIVELAAALDGRAAGAAPIAAIPNIQAKGGPRPPLRKPFEPIDALPFMARDLLDEPPGVINITTQRGCPFPCTYCAARTTDDLYAGVGEYGRRRSAANVLAELEAIRRAGPLAYVVFLDDTFTIHHPWVKAFCPLYRERLGVPFSLNARVETVSPELLRTLAAAGCRHIVYGVESGSERVRRDILHRPVSNQRFEDVFRWTREAGILATANYMLGMPGETAADIEGTLELHDRLKPTDFGYFVFYPYPGTALFHVCREKGYLPEDYLELPANHRSSILRLPDLSIEEIGRFYDRFTAVRERDTLARYGPVSAEHRAAASAVVRECAARG